MNSPLEDRLREALTEAGATVDASTLRPLQASGRRRSRVDLRMVAVAGVVLAGVAAAVLVAPGDQQRVTTANPPAKQEGPIDVTLFMCERSSMQSPDCEGHAATPTQMMTMHKTLKAMPDVERVAFEDQAAAYERFRREVAGNEALLDMVKITDMLASFQLVLKPGADVDAVLRKAKSVTRVAFARYPKLRDELLPDGDGAKADVTALLCGDNSVETACGAVVSSSPTKKVPKILKTEGKGITPAQQKAVAAAIDTMPGVQSAHFEDQQEAYENFKRAYASSKNILRVVKVSDMPTSFRLLMSPGADWSAVIDQLRRLPGVARVINNRCKEQQAKILWGYGISVPEKKLCGAITP
ncbi:permease-like cell division protein FtsX [Nonomuraea sp. NPDC005983]|uniref:permease-like cell division protein FtsX n=1 Tax=Nonomuraea sp. NPDC005983 TaxID=3155595 RepID=UPI0033A9EED6